MSSKIAPLSPMRIESIQWFIRHSTDTELDGLFENVVDERKRRQTEWLTNHLVAALAPWKDNLSFKVVDSTFENGNERNKFELQWQKHKAVEITIHRTKNGTIYITFLTIGLDFQLTYEDDLRLEIEHLVRRQSASVGLQIIFGTKTLKTTIRDILIALFRNALVHFRLRCSEGAPPTIAKVAGQNEYEKKMAQEGHAISITCYENPYRTKFTCDIDHCKGFEISICPTLSKSQVFVEANFVVVLNFPNSDADVVRSLLTDGSEFRKSFPASWERERCIVFVQQLIATCFPQLATPCEPAKAAASCEPTLQTAKVLDESAQRAYPVAEDVSRTVPDKSDLEKHIESKLSQPYNKVSIRCRADINRVEFVCFIDGAGRHFTLSVCPLVNRMKLFVESSTLFDVDFPNDGPERIKAQLVDDAGFRKAFPFHWSQERCLAFTQQLIASCFPAFQFGPDPYPNQSAEDRELRLKIARIAAEPPQRPGDLGVPLYRKEGTGYIEELLDEKISQKMARPGHNIWVERCPNPRGAVFYCQIDHCGKIQLRCDALSPGRVFGNFCEGFRELQFPDADPQIVNDLVRGKPRFGKSFPESWSPEQCAQFAIELIEACFEPAKFAAGCQPVKSATDTSTSAVSDGHRIDSTECQPTVTVKLDLTMEYFAKQVEKKMERPGHKIWIDAWTNAEIISYFCTIDTCKQIRLGSLISSPEKVFCGLPDGKHEFVFPNADPKVLNDLIRDKPEFRKSFPESWSTEQCAQFTKELIEACFEPNKFAIVSEPMTATVQTTAENIVMQDVPKLGQAVQSSAIVPTVIMHQLPSGGWVINHIGNAVESKAPPAVASPPPSEPIDWPVGAKIVWQTEQIDFAKFTHKQGLTWAEGNVEYARYLTSVLKEDSIRLSVSIHTLTQTNATYGLTIDACSRLLISLLNTKDGEKLPVLVSAGAEIITFIEYSKGLRMIKKEFNRKPVFKTAFPIDWTRERCVDFVKRLIEISLPDMPKFPADDDESSFDELE